MDATVCLAEKGNLEIVRYLIDQGKCFGGEDQRGMNILYHAAHGSHEDLVLYLLEKGEEREGKHERGEEANFLIQELTDFALARIAEKGRSRIVNLLLKRMDVAKQIRVAKQFNGTWEIKDDDLSFFLYASAAGGADSCVQFLLKAETECNPLALVCTKEYCLSRERDSPIRQAVVRGHTTIVQRLLDYMHARQPQMFCPTITDLIRLGAENNQVQVVRDLLGNKFVKELERNTLKPALSEASQLVGGHEEMMQLLVDHGAILDQGIEATRCMLRTAVKFGTRRTVRLILKATRYNPLENYKWPFCYPTLLEVAANRSLERNGTNVEMIRTLLETNNDIFNPDLMDPCCQKALLASVRSHDIHTVQYFIDHKFNPDHVFEDGYGHRSLLTAAIGSSNKRVNEMVKLILSYGADVNASVGPDKQTALLKAAINRSVAIKILLDHGADLMQKNAKTETPLGRSIASFNWEGLETMLRTMEARGILWDVDATIREVKQYQSFSDYNMNMALKYFEQHRCRMMCACNDGGNNTTAPSNELTTSLPPPAPASDFGPSEALGIHSAKQAITLTRRFKK